MRATLVDDLEDAARRARNGAALAAWRARRGVGAAPAGAPEKETPATGAGVEQTNETSMKMVTQVTAENDDDYWFPPPDGCDTPAGPDEFEILDEFESLPAANDEVVGEVAGAPPASVGGDAGASTVTPTQDLRRLEFTLFTSRRATRGERRALNWTDARAWIAAPGTYPSKKDCPLALPGLNDKNTREAGASFMSWGCVFVEHDDGVISLRDAAGVLEEAGIAALLYTSASHKPESPRWRAILPVAKPVTSAEEYQRHVRVLNKVFNGQLAPESADTSRGWFVGKVQGSDYEHAVVEGAALDDWLAMQQRDGEVEELPLRGRENLKGRATPAAVRERDSEVGDDNARALERAIALDKVDKEVLADVTSAIEYLRAYLRAGTDWQYDVWIMLGLALKSVAQAGYPVEARKLWHRVSERGVTYDRSVADETWDSLKPNRITYKSLLAFAQERGWVNPRSKAAAAAQEVEARRRGEDAHDPVALDWHALPEDPPDVPFVIDGWMPDGVVTLFAAHGGTGKSFLSLYIAICIAIGRHPFTGEPMQARRVGVYSCEDNQLVMQRRIVAYMRMLNVDRNALADRLLVLDATESDNVLFAGAGQEPGRTTARFDWVRELVLAFGAEVLIFDNASDAFDGNENDRARVRQFLSVLKRLAPAVLLLAHVDAASSMADADNAKGYSGSTAWHNSARSRWFMARDRDTDEIVLRQPKVNYAKAGSEATIRWNEQFKVFEVASVRSGRVRASDVRPTLLALVGQAIDQGRTVSPATNSTNSVFNTIKDMPGAPKGLKSGDVAREVNAWLSEGLARVEEFQRPNRSRGQRLVLTDAGRAVGVEAGAGGAE